jgi:predicted nucleotidyltransferase
MTVLNLETYLHDIEELCIQHKVKHLYAFGSVLTDKFNLKSDIDLMVDFEAIEIEQYADNYYSLKFSLEDILNRPVDLLEEKAVKNPYFKEVVDAQRQLIYGY